MWGDGMVAVMEGKGRCGLCEEVRGGVWEFME